ncbi:MAG: hypothetical protein PHU67_00710 [Sulfurovum sp.]|nr:hypothetical protein [Sulfurovum sp.]MDD3498860.1 hypothetical protein [Sulfurovum sp.]
MKIKRFLTMLVLFFGFSYADSNIQQDLKTIAKASNDPSKLYTIQVSAPGVTMTYVHLHSVDLLI